MYDVLVIGAGVTGCAVARELGRYRLRVCVAEKGEDVCSGTTKANSAIIHAGYDPEPGTLKAKYNVLGSKMMDQLVRELDFPFRRCGSLIVCTDPAEKPRLAALKARGEENGVAGLRLLDREEALALEPHLSDRVCAALLAETGGIVCPFLMTVALAENAARNGAEFRMNSPVQNLRRTGRGWLADTPTGQIEARAVVSCAGVYADVIHNLVSDTPMTIRPRRGDYYLLDQAVGDYVNHTVFMLPTALGKGVLVTPTVHGNLLVGPTAVDVESKEDTAVTAAGLESVAAQSALSVKDVPLRQVITSFAGLRATVAGGDFIVGPVSGAPGVFEAAGIDSPGLSSAPAIGAELARQVSDYLHAEKNPDFDPMRKAIPQPRTMTPEAWNALIRQDPAWGNVICRCETVTEGEIVEAIRRVPGARSLDGVKRRTRAGMGRCQAGFCTPKTMEILMRELHLPAEEIRKNTGDSVLIPRDGRRAD